MAGSCHGVEDAGVDEGSLLRIAEPRAQHPLGSFGGVAVSGAEQANQVRQIAAITRTPYEPRGRLEELLDADVVELIDQLVQTCPGIAAHRYKCRIKPHRAPSRLTRTPPGNPCGTHVVVGR